MHKHVCVYMYVLRVKLIVTIILINNYKRNNNSNNNKKKNKYINKYDVDVECDI